MDRELMLLGLLRQQEMHGYRLMEFLDRVLNTCVDIKRPTAYFLLEKMAEAGWVSQTEGRTGHRPPRRVYRLTPQGEAQFQRLLRENLASYSPALFPSDAGLAFVEALKPQEALSLLRQRRALVAAALARAQAAPPHPGGTRFVVEHQVRHLAAELEWLDEIMLRLSTPRAPQRDQRRASASKVAA